MSEEGYQGFNSPQFQVSDIHRLQELSCDRKTCDDSDEGFLRELEQVHSAPTPAVTKNDGDKSGRSTREKKSVAPTTPMRARIGGTVSCKSSRTSWWTNTF